MLGKSTANQSIFLISSYNRTNPVPLTSIQITAVIGTFLSMISFLANGYVLYIIYGNKEMRSGTYYGLINLSIANLLVAAFYPFTPILMLITYNSPLKHSVWITYIMCSVTVPIAIVSLMVANSTLAFIAVEKYYTLNQDCTLKRKVKKGKIFAVLVGLWFITMIQHWPRTVLVMDMSYIQGICTVYTDNSVSRRIMLTLSAAGIAIPFVIMCICHTKIVWKLKQRHRFFISAAILKDLKLQNFRETNVSNQKLNNAVKILRHVALSQFLCSFCWLFGFYATVLGYAYKASPFTIGLSYAFMYVCGVLTGLYGPILYIFYIKRFRQPLQNCFIAFWSILKVA
ncbi:Tachykinin-like peptides receptor 86C [Trichoplax sp. H2]|nr:Tachykinin-like peptides receptor 86C [Trichoplax sp. H2]|eukprot:RDD39993.1 Tachykinin-like peptides receptor 86C [Trichoplax sp. H2]